VAKDREREFRLRPRKPAARNERAAWASAYKTIMHYARMTSRRQRRSAGQGSGRNRTRPYFQRCAIRVIYTKNATAGQWRAHGRYLVRESVTFDGGSRVSGSTARVNQSRLPSDLKVGSAPAMNAFGR
jgi:hypothetical protein